MSAITGAINELQQLGKNLLLNPTPNNLARYRKAATHAQRVLELEHYTINEVIKICNMVLEAERMTNA